MLSGNGAGLFLQPRSPHGATDCIGLVDTETDNACGYWLTKTQLLTKNHVTLSHILIIQYFYSLVLTKYYNSAMNICS